MKHTYPERESKNLEFKSTVNNFSSLIKTCVAFANGLGGKIIIGIDDKTKQIIGVDDKLRNRIYDEFPNSLYDATMPSLLAEIYEKNFNDLSVIIIEIPNSIKKPVFVKNEGMPQGVYLRAGSSTRRANQEYVEELMRENKRLSFDEEIVHADLNILSSVLLKNTLKKTDLLNLENEKIIKRSSANSEKYYPTVLGTLVFCQTPEIYIPETVIHCTRFQGTEGRNIIQTIEIKGELTKQIEDSFRLIRSWLLQDYVLSETKLKGKTIIPEIALREAIINAVIHRKYWIPGAIKIALYDTRLEIFNPGNFPGLVDPNHLGDGTTYLRNPNLARMARKMGLVEKLGTGIKTIYESCQKAKLEKPEYMEGTDSVKIVFSFLPRKDSSDSDSNKILSLFNIQKEVRLVDVERYLKVSRNTATRKLNQLITLNKIIRKGKGPGVKYLKKS